jgi:type II secretory pathway pseudopilin PulG
MRVRYYRYMNARRGMTLIDVVVGTALILIIFTALFGLLRASVLVSGMVKSEATATAVANNQMEYIRSLPYNSVGTVGGIPSGAIPQNATTTEDGVSYGVRTFVDYYDDPADGLGAADTNGITEDYKRIKVSVTYVVNGKSKVVTFVSNYAPPGL